MVRLGSARRVLLLCLLLLPMSLSAQRATLTVDLQKSKGKVSPTLYGLMTEEINFSYDGGLYGELIRNRVFHAGWDEPAHWFLTSYGQARASMQMDRSTGASAGRPMSLKLTVEQADGDDRAGVANEGYWGIPVRPNTTYQASFYAKANAADVGAVDVALVSDDTGKPLATGKSQALTTEWKQYKMTLHTGGAAQTSASNRLVLSVAHAGTVWFDMVSLFPPTYHDRANGNRIDLMEKLAAMKPAFLRLPGGNYLEGDHINERFEWRKTIGPLVDRPTHRSPWNYQSSDGMGLLEFLEWCEDLRMKPLLAVYAGYSLMQEHVEPGADLAPYVNDALDEIEYVTGDASTKWGAERVKDGHPAPFPLDYVEIGNEDEFDRSGSYDKRYAQFYEAIKKKYPQLQLIATTPVKSIRPDVIDDHYYKRADEFFAMVHHYDDTDRKGPKIFVGEWATREGSPTTNIGAALGDAAWMTAMERNSDLIVMASYAPLFVNVNPGGMQWPSDLIGYDALTSYGSPSYYAQVLFSNHIGTEILQADLAGCGPRVFASATRDAAKGVVYLKVVNASSMPQALHLKLEGGAKVDSLARVFTLAGHSTGETNTLTDPTHLVPVESAMPGMRSESDREFAPYSINVIEIKAK